MFVQGHITLLTVIGATGSTCISPQSINIVEVVCLSGCFMSQVDFVT